MQLSPLEFLGALGLFALLALAAWLTKKPYLRIMMITGMVFVLVGAIGLEWSKRSEGKQRAVVDIYYGD
jgi:uncharacterized membrane protein YqjE